jgi:hypothetical protein
MIWLLWSDVSDAVTRTTGELCLDGAKRLLNHNRTYPDWSVMADERIMPVGKSNRRPKGGDRAADCWGVYFINRRTPFDIRYAPDSGLKADIAGLHVPNADMNYLAATRPQSRAARGYGVPSLRWKPLTPSGPSFNSRSRSGYVTSSPAVRSPITRKTASFSVRFRK